MSFPRYPEYKDSGVEWLGEVPGHWSVKRLRYVAELNPSKSEVRPLPGDTEVSFIPMESVGEDGSLDLKQVRPLEEVIGGYTYVRDGDVTFAKITPCFENGKAALMTGLEFGVGFGTTELTVLRPDPEQTTGDYLFRVIHSQPFRALGESYMYGAGGQKRVPDNFARDFQIAWPPKKEQQVIAAFLDHETARIDALIAEQQRLIELLKEKRQAVISHAVTKGLDPDVPMKDSGVEWLGEVPAHWEVRRLKDAGRLIGGSGFPHAFQEQRGKEVAFYKVGDIGRSEDGVLMPTPEHTITREEAKTLGAEVLPEGTLVWAKIGAALLLNRRRVIDRLSCIDNNMTAYVPDKSVLTTDWAYFWTSQLDFSQFVNGGAVPSLSEGYQSTLPLLLPPVDEQEPIIGFLSEGSERLHSLLREAHAAVELLRERRSALISAAVTGKIDVRGWRAESNEAEAELPRVAEPGGDYSPPEARA
ncbi:MAG: restriction endonuclease subunit S [Halothiobacillaceae bacterium]